MGINKQSNIYTIIYIVIMVIVVGAGLAWTSLTLKPLQQENINADKMKQILAAVHIVPGKDVSVEFNKIVIKQFIVNSQGEEIPGDAFTVDVEKQSKIVKESERELPVYECKLDDGSTKYVLPVYGAGLWGPIWGYVAVDSDGSTIYGAYFAHQGETPGLGAEIEKPAFSSQFDGKQLVKNGNFEPVQVVKKGMKPIGDADYVDGVSGGTITSKGVGEMLSNCLLPYVKFLEKLDN